MGLSIRAYARHRGVSDTAVHKAIRAGRITPGPDGTIDADRADREWERNSEEQRNGTLKPAVKVAVPAEAYLAQDLQVALYAALRHCPVLAGERGAAAGLDPAPLWACGPRAARPSGAREVAAQWLERDAVPPGR
jgi:hypothetical protein